MPLQNYICLVQEGEDDTTRWYFECQAEDKNHAQEQALDHSPFINVIAVYVEDLTY